MGDSDADINGLLTRLFDAFNRHDLDAIMELFDEDATLDMPRGPHPWGQRFIGKAQVREGLASRFKGLPDVHYGEGRHFGLIFARAIRARLLHRSLASSACPSPSRG